jgi:hypothetical protein
MIPAAKIHIDPTAAIDIDSRTSYLGKITVQPLESNY